MMKRILFLLLLGNAAYAQPDSSRIAHIGFSFPLSTNGREAIQFTNGASFHVIAGVSGAERAFCLSGISSVVKHDADGFILSGIVNRIGGNANGMQVAGITNATVGHTRGLQLAGFNNVSKKVQGCQLAGFSNVARDSVNGAQFAGFHNIGKEVNNQFAGFNNVARSIDGVQMAGFCNISKHVRGAQSAGFLNVAKKVSGAQVAGFANVAKSVRGTQIAGFVNVAKKVKGAQVAGFINIAESCDYPVALVNIIRNGEQYLGVTADESGTSLLSLRSGSKKMYGILGVGFNFPESKLRYGLEGGLGMHIPISLVFRVKTELAVLSLTDFDNGVYMKSSLRVLPALKLARSLELFAGPAFSFINTPSGFGKNMEGFSLWSKTSKGTYYNMNLGGMAGLQVRL